jgi:secondary thiamine-phosphate synthase enzyme
MINQVELTLPPLKRGFHRIEQKIMNALGDLPEKGMLNLFIKHTSAALMINENADPDVLADMNSLLDKIAPENAPFYYHTLEGSDDMPAHFKSAVMGVSLNIPITGYRLNLGTWQGIYLCEFRNYGGSRKIVLTVYY